MSLALGDLRRRGPARTRDSTRGQSLAEFTLVLPIMLILLLAVADFGRLFAAGITIESAARTAAEVASTEYKHAMTLTPIDYAAIHKSAWSSICDEADRLPNATPASGGGQCDGLPTRVCVHDGFDTECGNLYNGASGTAGCPGVAAVPTNGIAGSEAIPSKYVEVRVCYRFSTIFEMTLPSIGGPLQALGGDFFIERSRVFTVMDY